MEIINECRNSCWCHFCKKKINKGDKMLEIYKSARRGLARINICLICIEQAYKSVSKKDLNKIKKERLLEVISPKWDGYKK